MLSGIPQVAQIGPSLVAKNGTPFCLFTYLAGNEKTPLCFKKICIKHRGGIVQDHPGKVYSCQGWAQILNRTSLR